MKSLTQYIKDQKSVNESQRKLSVDDVKNFVKMQKDLGFKIDGTQLDDIVDVFLTYYDIDDVCETLGIHTTPADTTFSKKQKIKTEFRKLA